LVTNENKGICIADQTRRQSAVDRDPSSATAFTDMLAMNGKLAKFLRRRATDVAHFRDAQHGATAVEFALIAPAFLATLIAILQTCLFLFAQMALQNAAMEAGRYFMTGQAQNNNCTATQIINGGCGSLAGVCQSALFNCNNLILVVQTYSSFAAANTSAPQLYSNGQLITSWAYDPGIPGEVMVVQLVYPWSVIGGPLGFVLSNLPNNAAEMMGVSAFRVEPYSS
jgi:Flp pilus assembly protein TadG